MLILYSEQTGYYNEDNCGMKKVLLKGEIIDCAT